MKQYLLQNLARKVKIPGASSGELQKIVGAALRRDSSKPSRAKPAPTANQAGASSAVLDPERIKMFQTARSPSVSGSEPCLLGIRALASFMRGLCRLGDGSGRWFAFGPMVLKFSGFSEEMNVPCY